MSRTSPRALVLALATIMCCALVAGPAQAASKAEKKQNSAIKKNRSNTSKAASNARKARAEAKKVDVKAFKALLVAVKATYDAAKANGDVATINGVVVPAAIKGLTDLQTGLLALKAGLEQAGAGLTTLGTAYQSVEYGALRVWQTPAGSTPDANNSTQTPGFSANSADIPDDGNGALVAASLPVQVAGPTDLRARAAIRSNESDGGATGPPAGQVGAVLYAKCLSAGTANPSDPCAGAITPGGLVCAPAGPPAAFDFGPLVGSQSLKNLQLKSPRTGLVAPAFDAPLATSQDGVDSFCRLPAAGVYEVTLSGQFFDFPTSTTPGPTE